MRRIRQTLQWHLEAGLSGAQVARALGMAKAPSARSRCWRVLPARPALSNRPTSA
jgi:hypothetical protein